MCWGLPSEAGRRERGPEPAGLPDRAPGSARAGGGASGRIRGRFADGPGDRAGGRPPTLRGPAQGKEQQSGPVLRAVAGSAAGAAAGAPDPGPIDRVADRAAEPWRVDEGPRQPSCPFPETRRDRGAPASVRGSGPRSALPRFRPRSPMKPPTPPRAAWLPRGSHDKAWRGGSGSPSGARHTGRMLNGHIRPAQLGRLAAVPLFWSRSSHDRIANLRADRLGLRNARGIDDRPRPTPAIAPTHLPL